MTCQPCQLSRRQLAKVHRPSGNAWFRLAQWPQLADSVEKLFFAGAEKIPGLFGAGVGHGYPPARLQATGIPRKRNPM